MNLSIFKPPFKNSTIRDFLYIKPQKTSTTSIRMALNPYTPYNSVNGISIQGIIDDIHGHKSISDYKRIIKNKTGANLNEKTLIFISVRNPWDRYVSWFEYFRQKRTGKLKRGQETQFIEAFDKSFPRLPSISSFLKGADENSKIEVIRFENLQSDFDRVCNKIGLPPIKLNHENKTNRKHYSEYYDSKTKLLIEERYNEDIEYFNYEF